MHDAAVSAKETHHLMGPELVSRWSAYFPPAPAEALFRWLANKDGQNKVLNLPIDYFERSSIGSCYVALLGLTGSAAIVLVASIMANDAQHEAVVTLQRPTLTLADAAPFPLVSGVH